MQFNQQSNSFTNKKQTIIHYAIICKIIPKERANNDSKPKLEILLQKHMNNYSLISFLENKNKKPADKETIQYFLRNNFVKQCGSIESWSNNKPAAPPLIPINSIICGGSCYWIFMLPRYYTNWKANPNGNQFTFINYSNEVISCNNQNYKTKYGHCWVDFDHFTKECANQLVLHYKKKLICRNGQNCNEKDSCSFLHINEQKLPIPIQNNLIIEKSIVQMILTSSSNVKSSIGVVCSEQYIQLVSNSVTEKSTCLHKDAQLEINIIIKYQAMKFKLDIKNTSTSPLKYALAVHNLNKDIISVELNDINQSWNELLKQSNKEIIGNIKINSIYRFKDLPTLEILYEGADGFHKIVLRIPIFLYCYSKSIIDINASDSTIKDTITKGYSQLPEAFSFDIVNSKDKQVWFSNLKNANIPIGNPVQLESVEAHPIVLSLGDKYLVIILHFNANTLKVVTKYNDFTLLESIAEVIYAYSSPFAGFDTSLLYVCNKNDE